MQLQMCHRCLRLLGRNGTPAYETYASVTDGHPCALEEGIGVTAVPSNSGDDISGAQDTGNASTSEDSSSSSSSLPTSSDDTSDSSVELRCDEKNVIRNFP